jgi:hypothetical protein
MSETTTATGTPAPTMPVASLSDLSAYREAKSQGITEVPNPAATPAVEDAPDPEVEGDPELRKEIDALEAPKAEETPQEKAARTRRHKEAARKGYATRLANKAHSATERAERAERELAELRQQGNLQPGSGPAAPQATAPVARTETTDPSDPEPTLEAFMKAHPDHADPYAGLQRDLAKWDRRQEARADQAKQSEQQANRSRADAITAFDTHSDPLRRVHADFDAKVNNLILTGPMATVVFGAGELGPRLAYHLASNPDLHRRIASLPAAAQLLELGEVKATVSAAAKAAKETPPPVTAAPAPHTPVGGAALAPATFDPSKSDDLTAYRQAKAAGTLARS